MTRLRRHLRLDLDGNERWYDNAPVSATLFTGMVHCESRHLEYVWKLLCDVLTPVLY